MDLSFFNHQQSKHTVVGVALALRVSPCPLSPRTPCAFHEVTSNRRNLEASSAEDAFSRVDGSPDSFTAYLDNVSEGTASANARQTEISEL